MPEVQELSKEQAIQAMREGKKVTHFNFSTDEFIYYKDGMIHDENGYNIDAEFWRWRLDASWGFGWFIYQEQ